jgi:hypothetical protein
MHTETGLQPWEIPPFFERDLEGCKDARLMRSRLAVWSNGPLRRGSTSRRFNGLSGETSRPLTPPINSWPVALAVWPLPGLITDRVLAQRSVPPFHSPKLGQAEQVPAMTALGKIDQRRPENLRGAEIARYPST